MIPLHPSFSSGLLVTGARWTARHPKLDRLPPSAQPPAARDSRMSRERAVSRALRPAA